MRTLVTYSLMGLALIALALSAGYRIHPQNLPYYFKLRAADSVQTILLTDGRALTGTPVETGEGQIKIDVDGAALTFLKSEIQSMSPARGISIFEKFWKNYRTHHIVHPLLSRDDAKTLGAAVNRFLNEPERLAEEIKKKNPGLSMTEAYESQAKAMAAQAKARQARAPVQ